MTTQTGIVKWFNRVKGYGFIIPDEGDEEIFAHYQHIEGEGYRNLYEGDRVQFGVAANPNGRGLMATNITTVR